MLAFLLLLIIVLAVGGLGLFAYGLDHAAHRKNWRYMAAGVLCIGGGLPAVVNVAVYLEKGERAADPWECIHTHPEEQCYVPPMHHHCWTVEVCDTKRLRDAGGKD